MNIRLCPTECGHLLFYGAASVIQIQLFMLKVQCIPVKEIFNSLLCCALS